MIVSKVLLHGLFQDLAVVSHKSTMGGGQSVRATHFQRPQHTSTATKEDPEEITDDHHISISNKMVERLVEDAAIAGAGAAAASSITATPRGDYKDQVYMERLRCLDDSHSERTGLRIEDVNALVTSIDLRTANMVSVDPVCAETKQMVIDCYNQNEKPEDNLKCWDTVGAFTQCVHETRQKRLRARTQRDARDHARLSRHMALARENELRDLTLPKLKETASTP